MYKNSQFIPIIDPNRKYWLVRTSSGDYYEEFFNENYIGIGWNRLKLEDLRINRPLADIVSEKYPNERHNYVANQISTFANQINKGDIVLIPSKNSFYISFGEVIETDSYEENSLPDNIEDEEAILNVDFEDRCPYKKRKKVKWVKTVRRDSLDPYLFKLIYSHHTISDATPYASYIDRVLHSFFIKGEKSHFIIRVQKNKDINAISLLDLINETLSLTRNLGSETEGIINSKDIEIKLNVQSPGPIELIGNIQTIFTIAAGYIAVFGGNIKILGLELQTDGIWGKISQTIQEKHNRSIEKKNTEFEERRVSLEEEKLKKAVQELEVALPPELQINNDEAN